MRRSEASSHVYSVEISPSAWKQLGYLPVETYRRIREELAAVAAALTKEGERAVPQAMKQEGHAASRLSVGVDDVIAIYDVDPTRQCVVLLEVARRLPLDS